MVRNYKRKTNRGNSQEDIDAALKFWGEGATLNQTVSSFKIPATTLKRHKKNGGGCGDYKKCGEVKMIFPKQMETQLAQHLRNLDSRFYGLTPIKCRELAFEYANQNKAQLTVPTSWIQNKAAGEDWLRNFMTRHHLSIRAPEATSIARQSAFNKPAVNLFFNNLRGIYDRYNKIIFNRSMLKALEFL